MLAIVLYSCPEHHDRVRAGSRLALQRLANREGVRFYLTLERDEPVPDGFGGLVHALRCDCRPGYEYLSDKSIALLRHMLREDGVEHVLKVDSDVCLDPQGIFRLIRLVQSLDYAGYRIIQIKDASAVDGYHRGRCASSWLNGVDADCAWASPCSVYLAGGCYLLSRRAIRAALRVFDEQRLDLDGLRKRCDSRALLEDQLIGWLMSEAGFRPELAMSLASMGGGFRGFVKGVVDCASGKWGRRSSQCAFIGLMTPNRSWGHVDRLTIQAMARLPNRHARSPCAHVTCDVAAVEAAGARETGARRAR